MLLRLFILLAALGLAGCSRNSLAGSYETQGDTAKFKMTLELAGDGRARLVTNAKLGDPALDQSVATVMTIPEGRWESRDKQVVVTGNKGDGKPGTFQFALQPNGDLVWTQSGARFVRRG